MLSMPSIGGVPGATLSLFVSAPVGNFYCTSILCSKVLRMSPGEIKKCLSRIDARVRFKMYKLRAEGPPKKWVGAGRVYTF